MIFWSERPVNQWIYVHLDGMHKHPWCVMVGNFVRARCTTEKEASTIVVAMQEAFLRTTTTDSPTNG